MDADETLGLVRVRELAKGVVADLDAEADQQLPHVVNVSRIAVDAAVAVGHGLGWLPIGPLASVHEQAISNVAHESWAMEVMNNENEN